MINITSLFLKFLIILFDFYIFNNLNETEKRLHFTIIANCKIYFYFIQISIANDYHRSESTRHF